MGHDDFTLLEGQRLGADWAKLGIQRGRVWAQRIGLEPGGGLRRRLGFVPFPSLAGDPGIDRAVADRSEQPGIDREKRFTLRRQLQERFLNHVFRRIAPLPSVKLQRSSQPIDQASELLLNPCLGNSPAARVTLLSMTTVGCGCPKFF